MKELYDRVNAAWQSRKVKLLQMWSSARRFLPELWPYLRPHKGILIKASIMMAGVAALNGASAYILKPIIDNAESLKDEKHLMFVVMLVPGLFFVKMLVQFFQAYYMSYIGQKTVQEIREELFCHLHDLSVEFYWRKRSGEIMARVTSDLANLQSVLQFLPLYMVRDVLTVVGLAFVIFYVNWRFALVAMLVGPMAGFVVGGLGIKMRSAAGKSQVIIGQIYHRFQESLEGMAIIKAFNYEQGAIDRFKRENDELFVQMMHYLKATALSGPLLEFLGSLVVALLIYYGGRQIISGKMTAGDFAVFLVVFFMGYSPLKNIAQANATMQVGLVSWGRIWQLLRETPTVQESPDAVRVPSLKGRVTFEHVVYRYPSAEKNALEDVDLDIKPGEVVAFVGASGSGKTTIVNLLLRLFDPARGRVLYDGLDLKTLKLGDLRDHLGLVSQNTILFDDTVAANIALGNPSASLQAVMEAAKAADAHEFIEGMPDGYQTMLGERGVKLSGGQRQRLAIARALLKKPSVLLLDEATSNLDTASERAVQASLEKLLGNRTVIMVAHRLSTIQKADRIYVLNEGVIAESGTHDKLIAQSGIYKRLYEIQAMSS